MKKKDSSPIEPEESTTEKSGDKVTEILTKEETATTIKEDGASALDYLKEKLKETSTAKTDIEED